MPARQLTTGANVFSLRPECARRDVLDSDFLPLYLTHELVPDPAPEGDLVAAFSLLPSARALAASARACRSWRSAADGAEAQGRAL